MSNNSTAKHYSYEVCKKIADTYARDDDKSVEAYNMKQAIDKASIYFHDHCFYTAENGYFIYRNGMLEQFKESEFENTYGFKGFPKKLKDRLKNNMPEYKLTLSHENFEIDKERRLINTFRPIYASTLKQENIKEANEYVEFVKKYLFEIVSSNNEITYKYLLKHIACIIRGLKVPIGLVLFTATEGSGKTTLAMLISALIGSYNTCFATPENIVLYNWDCYGKPLVVIQETEDVKSSNTAFNDKLKNMLTEEYMPYRKMYQQPMNLKNINNIIMTTNFPLSNQSGRRYLNLGISTKWVGEYNMWAKLKDFSDDNLKALYDFFMSIDIIGFNAEMEAKAVEIAINDNAKSIEKMCMSWKFIKYKYALPKKDENIKKTELFTDFCLFCASENIKAYSKSTFTTHIKELNIPIKVSHGYDLYSIKGEEVYNEFKKRHLLTSEEELEFSDKQNRDADISKSVKAIDTFISEREIELEEENKSLKEEVENLKRQLEEMKQMQMNATQDENKQKTKKIKIIHAEFEPSKQIKKSETDPLEINKAQYFKNI